MVLEVDIDMQKLIKVLVTTVLLFANSAYAEGIDVKAAYGDALEFVAIKLLIAAILFYLLSYGLVNQRKDTAIKSARWLGSILVPFSIIAFPSKYEIERNIFEMALAAVGWFAIGFVIGYIWFKFKHIKDSNVDITNKGTYTNKKILLPIVGLISIGLVYWLFGYNGIGKSAKYDVYPSCKQNTDNCTISVAMYTFKVDKEKSQVIGIYKAVEDGSSGLHVLENCTVVDEHNWQCQGDVSAYGIPAQWTMVEDQVTMSDSTFTINDKTTTTYGMTFVKR
jgi:hypothetical protein